MEMTEIVAEERSASKAGVQFHSGGGNAKADTVGGGEKGPGKVEEKTG